MTLTGGSTIREQRSAFRRTKKAREATKVQVVVSMTLEHLGRLRILYHKTQLELFSGKEPKYTHDVQVPFSEWLIVRRMPILDWTRVYSYTGIPMVADFFEVWRPAMKAAVMQLNDLAEVQELGEVEINNDSHIVLAKKSE